MKGKARARLAAAGLVLLGFSLGVLADHAWLAHHAATSTSELTHEESMIAMLDTLGLSEEQRETIHSILQRYRTRVEQHLADVHPVILGTMDSARHEIEATLDPEQLVSFRDWIRIEQERLGHEERSVLPH